MYGKRHALLFRREEEGEPKMRTEKRDEQD
jgi:hypothetical protein